MGVLQVISDFITRWEEGYVYTAIKTYELGMETKVPPLLKITIKSTDY